MHSYIPLQIQALKVTWLDQFIAPLNLIEYGSFLTRHSKMIQ